MSEHTFIYVDNVQGATADFHKEIAEAVVNGSELPEEIADLFELKILEGYNADGSNRGIVDWK